MDRILDLVYTPACEWDNKAPEAITTDLADRYKKVVKEQLLGPSSTERRFQVRINAGLRDNNVPFVALIPPEQERSGAYGGMSFVLFPSRQEGSPALITMVVGTNGLAPDETVLGRPGHARKLQAICSWLRAKGEQGPLAWSKADPVRIDVDLPRALASALDPWSDACKRYGKFIYAVFVPPPRENPQAETVVKDALASFIDLFFYERRIDAMAKSQDDVDRIQREWLRESLPSASDRQVADLLKRRNYLILQGPPGTGKTELARQLLRDHYKNRGAIVQFHPGTTYESFIGGLAPIQGGAMGFTFAPTAGHLLDAAQEASRNPEDFLLVIDEVNRADLSKVLGEAIYLFEPGQHDRVVNLAHEFPGFGRRLRLPPNLHVLGTMNSSDRSIAILDLAVRRRFAFLPLWPQPSVVERHAGPRMNQAFRDLLTIFLEHATDDALALMPGHAYFLADDETADVRLRTEVVPLLQEYLTQGYLAGFADEVRTWLDVHGT